jgi:hypothetical protein
MRVPHLNCVFERRRMISDWRDWGHAAGGQKEKRSRDPLSPTRFSPDNRTQPARRTPKPRCLIAAFRRQSMPATQDDFSRSKRTRGAQILPCATRGGLCAEPQCHRSNFQTQPLQILLHESCQPEFPDSETSQSTLASIHKRFASR